MARNKELNRVFAGAILLMALSFVMLCPKPVFADDVESDTFYSVPWQITDDNELVLGEEDGNYTINETLSGYINYPWNCWNGPGDEILSVSILGVVHGNGSCDGMFAGLTNCKSIDLTGFDTSQVTSMAEMFANDTALESLDITGFNTSNVTSMSGMFSWCKSLSTVDVSGFNTSSVTDMSRMFAHCQENPKQLDVSNFDTSNVTNMADMFYGDYRLSRLDVTGFDTEKVKDFSGMFMQCAGLTQIDVSIFNTAVAENLNRMFANCNALKSLDLSNFNTQQATDMGYMLDDCTALRKLVVGIKWSYNSLQISAAQEERRPSFPIQMYNKYTGDSYNAGVVIPSSSRCTYVSNAADVLAGGNSNNELNFSTDVWGFNNYGDDDASCDTDYYQANLLKPADRAMIWGYLTSGSGGHCFGMAATVALNKVGEENFAPSTGNIRALGKYVVKDKICYYQAMQYLPDFSAELQRFKKYTTKHKLQLLAARADAVKSGGSPVVVAFWATDTNGRGWGHTILAYAVEEGAFTSSVTGRQYGHRILTYDSNAVDWNADYCILYNENTSAWEIPAYANDGAISNAGASIDSATNNTAAFDKYGDLTEIVNQYTGEVRYGSTNTIYMTNTATNQKWTINGETGEVTGPTELLTYRDVTGTEGANTKLHVVLPDDTAAYQFTTASGNKETLDLHILTNDKYIAIDCATATGAELDPTGKVAVNGNSGDFSLTLADNNLEANGKFDTYSVTGTSANAGETKLTVLSTGVKVNGDTTTGLVVQGENADTSKSDTITANGSATYGNTESTFVPNSGGNDSGTGGGGSGGNDPGTGSGGSSGGGSAGGGGAGGGGTPSTDPTDADKAAADAVIKAINDLPATITLENEAAVVAARTAYAALTEAQKALVSAEILAKLEQAEATITNWQQYNTNVAAAKNATSKIIKVKNQKLRKAIITWQNTDGCTGYTIAYTTDKKFKKGIKRKTAKAGTTKLTLKKLKKGKTYYFKVQPYTNVTNHATGEATKVAGKWSKAKKLKIKR